MCLFHSKVKEYCAMLIKTTVLGLGSSANIIEYVKLQHNAYNYMFPKARSLSVCLFYKYGLTLYQSNQQSHSIMHLQPYQNDWIIKTIWNLFFTREKSLVANFSHCFPTSEDPDGVVRHEVPEPMVALMATVVS
jgi:hypothetical protein